MKALEATANPFRIVEHLLAQAKDMMSRTLTYMQRHLEKIINGEFYVGRVCKEHAADGEIRTTHKLGSVVIGRDRTCGYKVEDTSHSRHSSNKKERCQFI